MKREKKGKMKGEKKNKMKGNKLKLSKNPSEPIEKDKTGGTCFWKREETCRIVPSPPRVIIKSIFCSKLS